MKLPYGMIDMPDTRRAVPSRERMTSIDSPVCAVRSGGYKQWNGSDLMTIPVGQTHLERIMKL